MRQKAERESGQAYGEYALILGGIAVVGAFVLLFLAGAIGGIFNSSGDPQQPGGTFTPPIPRSDLTWPTKIEDCQDGGWRNYAQFQNEEECNEYIESLPP